MTRKVSLIILLNLLCICAAAQTNEFTYQGKLTDTGTPSATYDFEFRLCASDTDCTTPFETRQRLGVSVTNGIFTVKLDFDEANFTGADRFLEVRVRRTIADPWTPLSPRQKITSSPYALKSLNAGNAENSLRLGGQLASQFVLTDDARLSDARDPLPNSANYIQNNPTGQQPSSSFNIGNGTASIFSASTQYNIGSNRILSKNGTDNLFAGVGAGGANTFGQGNSFFGAGAGQANTDGSFNAFFGSNAGLNNATGSLNAFFGRGAGFANIAGDDNAFFGLNAGANTTGSRNSFFGRSSGQANNGGSDNVFFGMFAGNANSTGNSNTIIGTSADLGSSNLSFASAIGAGSVVSSSSTIALGRSGGQDTVVIPGTLSANGSSLTNLNASNITSGTLAIANGGTGSSTQNFVDLSTSQTVGGNKSFTGTVSLPANGLQVGTDQIITSGGSVGIGVSPDVFATKLIVVGTDFYALRAENGFVGPSNRVGVFGNSVNNPGFGTGGIFRGGFIGVQGLASDGAFTGTTYGVIGEANGGAGSRFGVYGTSNGSGSATNYGVYGRASGGATNWAGYFDGNTHVSGNLGVGGTGTANILNANVQFNIAGIRMLTANGPYNLFSPNSMSNTFVGEGAGLNTTPDPAPSTITGKLNTFFGANAGLANTTGSVNTFLGRVAGLNNASGVENAFVGAHTGFNGNNTGGHLNTSLGTFSRVTENLGNQTAIGARAMVTQSNSLVLGAIAGVNASTFSTRVGIGTTAPSYKLQVIDESNTGVRVQTNTAGGTVASFGGNGAFQIDSSGIPGGRMVVLENGNVGIGTSPVLPDQRLTVNGNASKPGGGSWAIFSDERLKNVGGRFTRGLAELMRLDPIRYEYKRDNALGLRGEGEYVGFSAQEVERVLPEAVTRSTTGYLQINNDPILWTMLNAVKEQQAQIEYQQQQNKYLREQNQQQQEQIDEIRKLLCELKPEAALCMERDK